VQGRIRRMQRNAIGDVQRMRTRAQKGFRWMDDEQLWLQFCPVSSSLEP